MHPYPPFPPSVELALLVALDREDFSAAIAAIRKWKPGWGERDPAKGSWGLPVDERMLELFLEAKPPQIERFDEGTRKQLRVMALMTQFAGGENWSGSNRWSPGAVEWESWKEPVRLARMCFMWAGSLRDMERARGLEMSRKRVLGDSLKGGERVARCPYCQSIRERGFISIDTAFEPGILFPPFRGCTHSEFACRCMLEFA